MRLTHNYLSSGFGKKGATCYIKDLHECTAQIFTIGPKTHQGKRERLGGAPAVFDVLRDACRKKSVSIIIKNMKQGAQPDIDKTSTFKLPPASKPEAFVVKAIDGERPFDKSTSTKMLLNTRAARAHCMGKEQHLSSNAERTSMC